jgi:acyl CoA:acetate/3-ketoacid CoA transferase
MAIFVTAAEAVQQIRDDATVVLSGNTYRLVAESVLTALEARFLAEGRPRNLQVIYPIMAERARAGSGGQGTGVNRLARPGLMRRVVAGSFSRDAGKELNLLVTRDGVEAYNLPMGTIFQWIRATAARSPGLVTPVGLDTFVDPRREGGRMNAVTRTPLAELVTLGGEEALFYPRQAIDVAIVKGTTADEHGNVSLERDPFTLGVLYLAMAARNSGGTVIAEVTRTAAAGSLHPRAVVIPAALVDRVVVAPEEFEDEHDPTMSGEVRVALGPPPRLTLDEKVVIARRAVQELRPGNVVNLGAGIPMYVIPHVAAQRGIAHQVTFTIEQGPVGGLPAVGGVAVGPTAILDSLQVFDWYDGGGLDVACLAFGEVDRLGNVNVARFGGMMPGSGGFINIVHAARKVVFCGTLTSKGLRISTSAGGLSIEREGQIRRFVPDVELITFNGEAAVKKGQEAVYVTERAVFRRERDGMVLTELAPGLDVRRDVLDQVGFPVRVSPDLRPMPADLFAAD